MNSTFFCVTRGMERFSLDLPGAAKNRECALKVECLGGGGLFRSRVLGIYNHRFVIT